MINTRMATLLTKLSRHSCIAVFWFLIGLTAVADAEKIFTISEESRTWKNTEGIEIEGRLISVDSDWVTLEREDGQRFTFGLDILSKEDRIYVEKVVNREIFDHSLPGKEKDEVIPPAENLLRNGDFSLGERYWDGEYDIEEGVLRLELGDEPFNAFQDLRFKRFSERRQFSIRFRYRCSPELLRWNMENESTTRQSAVYVKIGYCDDDGKLRIGGGHSVPPKRDLAPSSSEWTAFTYTRSVEGADQQNDRYDVMLTFEVGTGAGYIEIDDLVLTEIEIND